ncbi:hypothetical protein TRIATDRAFT_260016 [Trichoderma atroviride IMI 206040]|uniref:Uncharacterized protein n=1 Tax=Hypocrea atroviridis (strain ATCC 20476 / IMI 206040) TaxID=452589 RepID=G9P9F6_HYPAI|nr:uncharacterized protein TRIATDRAFT_260016 [Trichoderma atroviride IMI 206040]EHK40281.1 hypothetical protein TRIATDRAFT_260016 [Trichoderma atroviride IMI 206040]
MTIRSLALTEILAGLGLNRAAVESYSVPPPFPPCNEFPFLAGNTECGSRSTS